MRSQSIGYEQNVNKRNKPYSKMKSSSLSKRIKKDKMTLKIVKTLKENGIKRASVFGSYARGEQKKESDIDIIIEPKKGMGLFNFVGVKMDLENKLKKKVDLITYKSINPYLKAYIKREQIRIL